MEDLRAQPNSSSNSSRKITIKKVATNMVKKIKTTAKLITKRMDSVLKVKKEIMTKKRLCRMRLTAKKNMSKTMLVSIEKI